MRFLRKLMLVAPLVAVIAGTAPASANLVQNGGFETGDFTGWNVVNNGFTGVECPGAGFVHSGNCDAFLGTINGDSTLSQTFADTSGQTLNVSYWLRSDGGIPNDFSAYWNGVLIAGSNLTNAAAFPYTFFNFDVLATGSDTLLIAARDDPGFLFLDDVSVGVPEPITLSLFGAGLAGAVAIRRRKKKAA